MMIICVAMVLMNALYEYMKSKYSIPRSTITSHVRNICHPLQYINMRQLQKRTKTGEVSISNLREVLQISIKSIS